MNHTFWAIIKGKYPRFNWTCFMEKYNVIFLLWMIRYISLFTNAFTVDFYWCIVGFFIHPSVAMRWVTSMTFYASMWNGAVDELASCVI